MKSSINLSEHLRSTMFSFLAFAPSFLVSYNTLALAAEQPANDLQHKPASQPDRRHSRLTKTDHDRNKNTENKTPRTRKIINADAVMMTNEAQGQQVALPSGRLSVSLFPFFPPVSPLDLLYFPLSSYHFTAMCFLFARAFSLRVIR